MARRALTWAVLWAALAPARGLVLTCADALELELDDTGRVVDLTLDRRPAPVEGTGGWSIDDGAGGTDETYWFGLTEAWESDNPFGLQGSMWRLGAGWTLSGELFNGGRIATCADPPSGYAGYLRFRLPVAAEATYSLRLFVRREEFRGRARVGIIPLDAVGRAAGPMAELEPAAGGRPDGAWTELRGSFVALPATAFVELVVSLEEASGRYSVGGLAVTYHGPGRRAEMAGTLTAEGAGARFVAEQSGLRLEATYRPLGRYLLVDAALEATDGAEHGVTLTFTLPLAGGGWTWWHDLRRSEPVPATGGKVFANWLPLHGAQVISPYPVGCVSRSAPAMALALATPMSQPMLCRHGFRQGGGLFCAFDLGLVPRLQKQRVELRLAVLAPNAAWGLRGALEDYYTLYDLDTKGQSTRVGAWFTALSPDAVPHPGLYGLMFDEQAASHLEWSRGHELASLAGLMPWGRFRRAGGVLPETAGGLYPLRVTDAEVPSTGRMVDAQGQPVSRALDDGGEFVPWWTDPDLLPDGPIAEINAELASLLQGADGKPLDGLLVDGLGAAWAGWQVEDHNGEHLAVADLPLSYSRTARSPVCYSAIGHLELLGTLSQRLHANSQLVLGSLSPEALLPFVAPFLDVLCGGERTPADEFLMWLRVVGYQKPVTFLDPTILDPTVLPSEQNDVWQRAVLWGAFPGAAAWWSARNLALHRPYFEVYVPRLRALAQAGWEPVPYATLSDADVELERYGEQAELYFVIRNPTNVGRNLVLTVYPRPLQLLTPGRGGRMESYSLFVDLLSRTQRTYWLRPANDRWQVNIALPPRGLMVLTPYKVGAGFEGLGAFDLLPEPTP